MTRLFLGLVAVALVPLAACSAPSSGSAAETPTVSMPSASAPATPAVSTAAPDAPAAAPTAAPDAPPVAGAGGQSAAGGVPRCVTGELKGALGRGGAAAGSVYRPLLLTNTGKRTCELVGFPGVSYVAGDNGAQVGPAAEMRGPRAPQVNLAPGAAAAATVQLVNVGNFDPASCKPVPVRGLRVYPPGDTASLFVPLENGQGCTVNPPQPQLFVESVKPA